jgi:hypothetical protein
MMRNPPHFLQTLLDTGFQIHETLDGLHEFVAREGPAGELPVSFDLDWGSERLIHFLNPLARETFLTAVCRGVIRVGELVAAAPCTGTLEFRYFSEAKIRYRLSFQVGKANYEYIGEKTGLRPWNLHRTHTTCYGVIYELETGKEISRSRTTFRLSTLPSFLKSFGVIRSGTETR